MAPFSSSGRRTRRPVPFQGHTSTQIRNEYNFTYTQGWISGTQLQVAFDNSRVATNQPFTTYSPALNANFLATVTQHLAYGFGPGINKRFIIQAQNDRKISDAGFRLQILYTVNQVENIYVGLVSAYEDVQSKQRALEQSKQLAADNRKQLQIGTMAPLDVVQSDSNVASDQQALVASQSALEYQQLVMKQAIARNLNDPLLASAPVIPTDRISILETPEERMPVDDLVKEANANRPDVQQVLMGLKNDEITVRALKNGLLPQVDLYAFYGGYGVGGARGPNCTIFNAEFQSVPCTEETTPTIDYSHTFQNLFNNSGPNKGVGLTLNIPIRNRQAQSAQLRSMLEYRQAQLQVQQIYLKVRMQVINGQYALTNDRAQVESAQAAADYNRQSLDSEQKKYHLGASTTANVLLQQRNLSNAENNLITARATYAKDRAAMTEILGITLDRYGISLEEAVTGNVKQIPVIPGLEPARPSPRRRCPINNSGCSRSRRHRRRPRHAACNHRAQPQADNARQLHHSRLASSARQKTAGRCFLGIQQGRTTLVAFSSERIGFARLCGGRICFRRLCIRRRCGRNAGYGGNAQRIAGQYSVFVERDANPSLRLAQSGPLLVGQRPQLDQDR